MVRVTPVNYTHASTSGSTYTERREDNMNKDGTMTVRIYKEDYPRLLAISNRMSNKESRRVSLAEAVAACIDKYPKLKKGK